MSSFKQFLPRAKRGGFVFLDDDCLPESYLFLWYLNSKYSLERCFHISIIGCQTVGFVMMYELYKLITEQK